MRIATEALIQTTMLANHPLFGHHDSLNELDWETINGYIEHNQLDPQEESLIWFLGFLDGQNDYNLDQTLVLDQENLLAILESLKIAWSGIDLQENL